MNQLVYAPMFSLCDIKSGKSNTRDADDNGEYTFFDRSKIIKKSSRYLYDCEALIIAGEGTVFLPKHYKGKFDLHQRAYALHNFKPSINVKYLYYYLHHLKDYLPSVAVGATVKSLRRRHFENLPVVIFPIKTQQKIVAKLDRIFAEIDNATAMVETNAKNAEALFKSYLSEVFKRGGEDWKLTTLGEYYDVRDGTHDSPKFQDSGYPLVTSKNLKDGNITFKKIKYISKKDYLNISQRSVVKKGDVLMAMIGTIGNPVVVDTDDEFAIKNVALFKTNNSQSSKFLSYYLSSDYVIKKMEKDCKGTTQKFVGLGYLRSFPIKIPNKNTQEKVAQTLSEYEKYIKIVSKSYVKKLNEILYLKNSILKQAFNGELVKAA